LFLVDLTVLYFAGHEIRARGTALLRVIAAVGDVDAAISIASFRAGTPHWTWPRFHPPGSPTVLTDLRHPLLETAVPNSITLGPPYGILVTGSNMSGKTTFVRTLGVTTVLAQTINTCLATAYDGPVFHVRSCIGRADDLLHGKSYYLVEVEAVLALVRASRSAEPHLFLFDELFRGTNAVERIAAAEAVLCDLTANQPHIVVAATHDGELVDLLRHSYAPYHFTDSLGSRGLVFEYRLQPGPATTRNAIALLKLHGAPESLVSRALARAAELDRAHSVSSQGSRTVTGGAGDEE
jgi:DNA mismatch repair ATPase MutS